MQIFLILPLLLQASSGLPQQQLVTQMLGPSQAATLGPAALGPMQGPTTSLGQILINLLNYKLQWLNQLAGQLTGLSPGQGPSLKPGLLGALGALSSGPTPALSRPHHGYPFMTTLVTTLSGHAPTVPGITIAGAPVNHLPYPGAPTPAPLQDFHWIPAFATEPPQTAQPPATTAQATALQATAPAVPAAPVVQPPQPAAAPATVPVIPTIDDVPVQTIIQPGPAAPAALATPAVPAAPPAAAPTEIRAFK